MKKILMVLLIFVACLYSKERDPKIDRDTEYMVEQVLQCMNKNILKTYTLLGNMVQYKISSEKWIDAMEQFYNYMEKDCPKEYKTIDVILSDYNKDQSTVAIMFFVSKALIAAGDMMKQEGIDVSKAGLELAEYLKKIGNGFIHRTR